MNLHDIPDPRAEPPRPKWQQAFSDVIARGDLPGWPAWPVFRQPPERVLPWLGEFFPTAVADRVILEPDIAPTIAALPESQVILRRLNSQWMVLQRARLTSRDMPMVSFFLTVYEWDVLINRLRFRALEEAGFLVGGGVEPMYRGYPLRIVYDYADPLRRLG